MQFAQHLVYPVQAELEGASQGSQTQSEQPQTEQDRAEAAQAQKQAATI